MIYDASKDETTAGLVRGWLRKPWSLERLGVLLDRLEELGIHEQAKERLACEPLLIMHPTRVHTRRMARWVKRVRQGILPLFNLKELTDVMGHCQDTLTAERLF